MEKNKSKNTKIILIVVGVIILVFISIGVLLTPAIKKAIDNNKKVDEKLFNEEKNEALKYEKELLKASDKYLKITNTNIEDIIKTSNVTIDDLVENKVLEKNTSFGNDGYVLYTKKSNKVSSKAYVQGFYYKTKGYEEKYAKKTKIYAKNKGENDTKVTSTDNIKYSLDISYVALNKKVDYIINNDFTVTLEGTKYDNGIYTINFIVNDEKISEEYLFIDKESANKENNNINIYIFDKYLLYEGLGRTDIKQLTLTAVSDEGKVTNLTSKEILEQNEDIYPYSFEVDSKKIVITGRRTYHGPSVIYYGNYYGICRSEQEGIGLASELPDDLAVEKEYTFEINNDNDLKKTSTKTTKVLKELLQDDNYKCTN